MLKRLTALPSAVKQYLLITSNYWFFTLTDGALRMLVLLHFRSNLLAKLFPSTVQQQTQIWKYCPSIHAFSPTHVHLWTSAARASPLTTSVSNKNRCF